MPRAARFVANCEYPGKGRDDRPATDNRVNSECPAAPTAAGWIQAERTGRRALSGRGLLNTARELPSLFMKTRIAPVSLGESHWEAGGGGEPNNFNK